MPNQYRNEALVKELEKEIEELNEHGASDCFWFCCCNLSGPNNEKMKLAEQRLALEKAKPRNVPGAGEPTPTP
ncbi:hypothetical protein MAM1_0036c02668 [Mucor ambiguus]|uniref:Uncharacterized protein n=1 Tax=Mucor ambiguus TaxID=91626 RepID=A0A0C9MJB3_9FUNG|nr:hypothetical protein MAM1_0036c02668 [Mucor ambiguus]